MDRIEGELTELRAQCAEYLDEYLDDVETMCVARQEYERSMHERVTRLEDSMFELIYELRLLRQR